RRTRRATPTLKSHMPNLNYRPSTRRKPMKSTFTLLTTLGLAAAAMAAEPPTNSAPAEADRASNQPAAVAPANGTNAPAETVATGTNSNGSQLLRMNFRGASLEQVLNYLSEAAGFIINVKPGTSIRGKVDVWSNDPLTREEALNLVDSVLNQNGL